MSDDRIIPARLKLTDDPQGRQQIVQSLQQVDNALTDVGTNPALLKQAENARTAEAAFKKSSAAASSAAGSGASAGGATTSSKLGLAGAGVGQLASIAGVSGQAGGAISLLGSSIGTMGAAGAAAAVGMVGLGLIMGQLRKASEEADKAFKAQLETQYAMNAAMSLTTLSIEEQIASKEAELVIAERNLATAQEAHALADRSGALGVVDDWRNFVSVMEDAGPPIGAANEALEEAQDKVTKLRGEVEGLTGSLDTAEVAANDAAKALEEQAEAQTDALLEQTDALGKLMKAENDASKRTKEGNQDRLQAIREQQKILQAQIATLKASGLATEGVIAKLEGLEAEMKSLGAEAGVVGKAIAQGTSADKAAANERAKIRAQERADARQAAREAARERAQQRREEEEEKLKDAIDFANKIKDIQYNTAKQQYDIQIQANRDQERLLREFTQQRDQDFYQDFLGLYQRQNDLAFQLNETQISAGQGLSDASREGFMAQQKLRGETPGAQQLLTSGGGGNTTIINTGLDPNAINAILQGNGMLA